ncbi:MAG: (d)CMP kinase [Victivallaceae bacterium]|nr:(d)CMP kinase [Victivallaceae bacterium]
MMKKLLDVIAIDGPAGAGKSTAAKKLAEVLCVTYVNTGSLYRAIALAAARAGIDVDAVTPDFLNRLNLEYRDGHLLLNGEDPGEALRGAEIASGASRVSALPFVREYLLPVQRNAAKKQWIIMEGRDIGTVIFPDARCKFFVTADIAERARRRLAQRNEVDAGATLESVIADIRRRDERDAKRATAPRRQAPDAFFSDRTGKSIDEVNSLLSSYLPEELRSRCKER